jgi:hypothetical protein
MTGSSDVPPDRPVKVTVVPVEPGFAEIMSGGKCVGVAMADFWMVWKVRLFPRPGLRSGDAVPPYELGSLRAVRADVKGRVAGEGPWWSETAAREMER